MKSKTANILIVILVIAQIISYLRISSLRAEIQNARNEINYLRENTSNEINMIYSNVGEMLKREASLIESASVEAGTPDKNSLTVPVTFSLTPKEVSANTAVYLDFNGETFPMDKNGTTYSATVSRNIFDNVQPLIIIDENGVEKTTQDARINVSLKSSVLPEMHARLIGEGGYSRGTYTFKGTINADYKKAVSGIGFAETRFIIKVDDNVFSDEVIPAVPPAEYPVDVQIPLTDGQVCTMTVSAADSLGLLHHFTVNHWVGGSSTQREPFFNDESIYSADGALLWSPEYERIDGNINLKY